MEKTFEQCYVQSHTLYNNIMVFTIFYLCVCTVLCEQYTMLCTVTYFCPCTLLCVQYIMLCTVTYLCVCAVLCIQYIILCTTFYFCVCKVLHVFLWCIMFCTIFYNCVCMFSTMCTVHYMLCIFTFIILFVVFVKMLQ